MFGDFYDALGDVHGRRVGKRDAASFARTWIAAVEDRLAALEAGTWDRVEAAAEGSLVYVRLAETVEQSCPSDAISGMYERAVALARESDDTEAIREALFCMGRWQQEGGRWEAAAELLRRCLAHGARGPDTVECLAQCLVAGGARAEVVLWFYDWLLELQPYIIDHYIARAQVELGLDPESTEQQAELAEPDDMRAAARRIAALHVRHRWKQAVRAAEAALGAAESAGHGEWLSGLRAYIERYR